MAEMVRHGVDGLLFRAGDARALADAMARAATEPLLWRRLVRGARAPVGAAQSARAHLALYRTLGAGKARRTRQGRAA
jgi:glycosyltransferase involved in cell wall biosynthesis